MVGSLEEAKAGRITLRNTLDFMLADYITLQYSLNVNGEIVAESMFACPSIEPHEEVTFDLPDWPEESYEGEVDLVLSYHRLETDFFFDEGDLLGHDQYILDNVVTTEFLETFYSDGVVFDEDVDVDEEALDEAEYTTWDFNWEDTGDDIVIDGELFRYVFSKHRGIFTSIVYDQTTILTRPMEYNVWRAPTDNDRRIRQQWEQLGMDRAQAKVPSVEVEEVEQGLQLTAHVRLAAPSQAPIVTFDAVWTVEKDGRIYCDIQAERFKDLPWLQRILEEGGEKSTNFMHITDILPWLPRFGVRLFLPACFDDFKYHGYGPYESYVDKHQASIKGTFEQSVKEEMYVNYLIPQEHGNRWGVQALRLSAGETGPALCLGSRR